MVTYHNNNNNNKSNIITIVWLWKPRNKHVILLTKPWAWLGFLRFPHRRPFLHSIFHCISLPCLFRPQPASIPQAFPASVTLAGLKGKNGTRDTFTLGMSHFLVTTLKSYILSTAPRLWHWPPQPPYQRKLRSACLIIGDVTLSHMEEAVSARCLHCKKFLLWNE